MRASPASRSPTRTATSQVLLALSCDSPAEVDELVDAAASDGGKADPGPKQDMGGMMYGRSFEDPDGHHWEPMWMDAADGRAGRTPSNPPLLLADGRLERTMPVDLDSLRSRSPPFAGFPTSPPGLVRDLRIRWALEEIERPYQVRLLDAMNPRPADYFHEQPFGQVPAYQRRRRAAVRERRDPDPPRPSGRAAAAGRPQCADAGDRLADRGAQQRRADDLRADQHRHLQPRRRTGRRSAGRRSSRRSRRG